MRASLSVPYLYHYCNHICDNQSITYTLPHTDSSLSISLWFSLLLALTTFILTITITLSHPHSHSGVTRPRPCVFLSAACPHERMANPLTYTIAGILLSMFIVFILSYEFFVYRRVKSQVRLQEKSFTAYDREIERMCGIK